MPPLRHSGVGAAAEVIGSPLLLLLFRLIVVSGFWAITEGCFIKQAAKRRAILVNNALFDAATAPITQTKLNGDAFTLLR